MERIISQEERIRRAEEIYNKRRAKSCKNDYKPNLVEPSYETNDVKKRTIKKMMVQIVICTSIYLTVYLAQNSSIVFQEDMLNKAKEILAYDISAEKLYSKFSKYIPYVKEKLNVVLKTNENVNNTETNGVDQESNESQKNVESTDNQGNVEDQNIAETSTQDTVQEAVGGAEENVQKEEKSQEELDIEYVKQNINIIWPLNGVITSKFGTRTPTEIVTANHYGIDIAGNTGDNIISAMDGTVTQVSTEGDYGKHLRIESGEVMTLYAHCSELLVQEGDNIKQGDIIAKVGQTGRATGPHLHFEIRRENRYINPEEILGSL